MTSDRAGAEIAIACDGEALRGHLAVPPSGRGRGVLVISEGYGLVDSIRGVCERLAREGFVALAPDLYDGGIARDADEAARLVSGLDVARAERILDAAVAELFNRDATDGPRVGALGFCAGGTLALLAATRNRRIGAVVDFYGRHPAVDPDLTRLEAPVLAVFGERDALAPPDAARRLEADLEAAGKRARVLVRPGVGHGFMNEARPDAYDAAAAAESWDLLLAFLRAELA